MEAIILIGLQGAGKSSFYRERFFHTHIRLNLDMLRTRHRERILLQACLSAKQPFVVDNTNVLVEERALYIALAKQAGFRVVGYYFRADVQAALKRNSRRTGKAVVPDQAILGTYRRLQVPRQDEGFDQLYYVSINEANEFEVREWLDEVSH
jgi:predicted kinase